MKVTLVPKHYSFNATPDEMMELILGFRTYVREYHVTELAEEILSTMEAAYAGELGEPPGDPIDEEEGGALVA